RKATMRAAPCLAFPILWLAACAGAAPEPGTEQAVEIPPAAETAPTGDEGNDVVLWVNESNPGESLLLGSAGLAGVEVYGLDGALRARVEPGGEVGSVGIIDGFPLDGAAVPLVAALDVTTPRVHLYRLDADGTLA